MRILLVEDDLITARAVSASLTGAGYIVDLEENGEEAWFKGDTESYSAIVLDLGLPGMDGLSILKRWRHAGQTCPVLILTARGDWNERVEGIDAGADDYLSKPFKMPELIARVRAIIRRSTGQATAIIPIGALSLDTRQMQVSLNDVPIHLSPQEYRLVSYLMHHAGRVISQLELTEQLYVQDFERESNSIEVLVGRVRKKLGLDLIKTKRGFGYVIDKPAS